MSSSRNNNRRVSTVSEVLNVPLSIRGKKYHLIAKTILDGCTLKADIRYWINDNGRIFPTTKGLRFTYVDLMNIRKIEVKRRALLLDFFKLGIEFSFLSGSDLFNSSILYDVIDEVTVYDLRRCYIHRQTSEAVETSRGIKLTEEDIHNIKEEIHKQSNSYDLIGMLLDNLHSCFRIKSDVA